MHLCSAVQFLHRHRIVHLDLKPSNVISDLGQAKLIDLSIARAPQLVKPGIGTRRYMAPEQVHGGEIGTYTDMWGLGAVLFEAAPCSRPVAASAHHVGFLPLFRNFPIGDAKDGNA